MRQEWRTENVPFLLNKGFTFMVKGFMQAFINVTLNFVQMEIQCVGPTKCNDSLQELVQE